MGAKQRTRAAPGREHTGESQASGAGIAAFVRWPMQCTPRKLPPAEKETEKEKKEIKRTAPFLGGVVFFWYFLWEVHVLLGTFSAVWPSSARKASMTMRKSLPPLALDTTSRNGWTCVTSALSSATFPCFAYLARQHRKQLLK